MKRKTVGKHQKAATARKRRCIICGSWFVPFSKTSTCCSDECRQENRRRTDRRRYSEVAAERKKKRPARQKTAHQQPVRKLTHKGKLKQVFATAKEAIASLKPSEIASVESIMALPHILRWNAGAKNWTEAQRVLARKIELKEISNDARIFEEEDSALEQLNSVAQSDQEQTDDDDFISDDMAHMD